VSISITEWSPLIRLERGGQDLLLADSGAMIDTSAAQPSSLATIPVLIDDRPSGQAINPTASFVQVLDQTITQFPSVFGCNVVAFEWSNDGLFSVWTSAGWKAILGHMDTSDQIASIGSKLSALTALRSALSFTSPSFGYIDLENSAAPAVGGSPGLPASVKAALAKIPPSDRPAAPAPTSASKSATATTAAKSVAPSPSAQPATASQPSAAAAPPPQPSSTPFTFYVSSPPSR
jgi:hypothetical protein